MKDLKILIVGAGIAGLSLAAYLKKSGFNPVVIERAREWKTIGYVLGMWSDGIKMLEGIGAAEVVKKKGKILPGFNNYDGEGKPIFNVSFKRFNKKYGPVVEIERDFLHRALREVNKDADIRMGMTVKSLKQKKNGVDVTFSNGKKEAFDLVVGADGIDSDIRNRIMPKEEADYSGMTFCFAWMPAKKLGYPKKPLNYFGSGKGVGLFPTKSRKHVAVLFGVPAKRHRIKDPRETVFFLRDHYGDMGAIVPTVLENLPEEPAAIFNHDDDEMHVKKWYKNRVVLIGDAAHALTPLLGLGASMALEDSYVLADELSKCEGDVPKAFKNFQDRRKWKLKELAVLSKITHRMIAVERPFYKLRNMFMKYIFGFFYYRYMDRFLSKKI